MIVTRLGRYHARVETHDEVRPLASHTAHYHYAAVMSRAVPRPASRHSCTVRRATPRREKQSQQQQWQQ